MYSEVIVQPGQCLEDIALQAYGSIDAVYWLLRDNEDVLVDGYSTQLEPGTVLKTRPEPMDRNVHGAMRKLGVVPATHTDEPSTLGDLGDYLPADFNTDHYITP